MGNTKETTAGSRAGSRLLRRREVEQRCSLSTRQIYREMETGGFPRPVKVVGKRVAWVEEEVQAWIDARIAERDAGHAA